MWVTEKFFFTKFRFADTIYRMVGGNIREQWYDGLLLVEFLPKAARGSI